MLEVTIACVDAFDSVLLLATILSSTVLPCENGSLQRIATTESELLSEPWVACSRSMISIWVIGLGPFRKACADGWLVLLDSLMSNCCFIPSSRHTSLQLRLFAVQGP
jgi:hypothetical protein